MGKALVIRNANFSSQRVCQVDLDDTYSGLGVITYGSTELYESSGGGSSVTISNSDNYEGIYPSVPAHGNGVLKSVRVAYAANKTFIIHIGTVDANNIFTERIAVQNVTILGGKVETNLIPYNIKVREGEIVLFQENDNVGKAYYKIVNEGDSNLSQTLVEDLIVGHRSDIISSTLYYKIDHGEL